MTNERLDVKAIRARYCDAFHRTAFATSGEAQSEIDASLNDIPALLEKVDELQEALKGAMVIAEEAKRVIRAKKDGRLVKLPCNVGDTVYEAVREWDGRDCIKSSFRPCVKASRVCSFHITMSGDLVACLSRTQSYAVFGKDFFLTPEEAGGALGTEVKEDAGNGRSDSEA